MSTTKQGEHYQRKPPFARVLAEWRKLNEQIAREWRIDVPWWYNERASLSVLAGAISSSGAFSFEEFSEEKRRPSPRAPKVHASYRGRIDIYFCIRRREFIGEAKICWPRCGRLHPSRQKMIESSLDEACQDIARCPPNGQTRLGILFVAPRWKRSLASELDERIDLWISRIREVDCDAIAWIFPKCARRIHAYGYLYPGVAIFIKQVKRWKKSPTSR